MAVNGLRGDAETFAYGLEGQAPGSVQGDGGRHVEGGGHTATAAGGPYRERASACLYRPSIGGTLTAPTALEVAALCGVCIKLMNGHRVLLLGPAGPLQQFEKLRVAPHDVVDEFEGVPGQVRDG